MKQEITGHASLYSVLKDKLSLMDLSCRFTAHVADPILCHKSSVSVHIRLTNIFCLTSSKREKLLLKGQVMAGISETEIIICTTKAYR